MSASGPGDRFVGGEVVLTLAGAASSALAIGVVWFGSAFLDFDLSTLTLWFIVPAGAVATGMLAASGYYLGAGWTGRRPTRLLLLNMVLVGFTTFVVLRYLAYSSLVFEDGTPISSQVGFWEYYRVSIEHMTMTVGRSANPDIGTTGELGMLGYGVETLQFAGFLLGPVAVWFMLAAKPYCEPCARYFRTRAVASSDASSSGVEQYLAERGVELPAAGDDIDAVLAGRPLNGLRLKLEECPSCQSRRLALFAVSGEEEVPAGRFDVTSLNAAW